jgi:hypothetical protein
MAKLRHGEMELRNASVLQLAILDFAIDFRNFAIFQFRNFIWQFRNFAISQFPRSSDRFHRGNDNFGELLFGERVEIGVVVHQLVGANDVAQVPAAQGTELASE